jgi:UDP-N-acetylglucosamine acyltransferase
MAVTIHPTAIVEKGAEIGEGSTIGAYSFIGANVKLGKNNIVHHHAVIEGHSSFGDDNNIFSFTALGTRPQDLKYKGEPSELRVGNGNLIREYVTLQPGTEGGGMVTTVGNRNLFMVSSHLGHDSVVGDDNVIANSVAIAGHVKIENRVTLGGLSGLHQFIIIGSFAMIGGGSMVTQDIPPGVIAQGDRARLIGVNAIGLQRAGFSEDDVKEFKKLYRHLFLSDGNLSHKVNDFDHTNASAFSVRFVDFIKNSSRGVASTRSNED